MSLKDDIYNGLKALPRTYSITNELDENGWALIQFPFPSAPHALHEDELTVQVRIDETDSYFTLHSPLAILKEGDKGSIYEHMLRRNFYAEQTDAMSYAINQVQEHDVLQAVYHWMQDSIDTDDFKTLIETMMQNIFTLLDEVDSVASRSDLIDPINK